MSDDLLQVLGESRGDDAGPRLPWSGRGRRLLVLAIVVLVLGVAARLSVQAVVPRLRDELYASRVESLRAELLAAAEESGLDPYLLAGVMCSESSGRVGVVSSAGALGLFQLMPATARERARRLGLPEPTEEDLLSDAALNARLGADYLAWLLRLYDGDVRRSLVAYNAGPGRLKKLADAAGGWDEWVAEREAAGDSDLLAYVRKVMMLRDQLAERELLE